MFRCWFIITNSCRFCTDDDVASGWSKKKTVRIELKNTKMLLSNRREMKVVIRDNDAYFNETERPRVNQVWCGVAVIDRRNVG